jgi:hypothetical protein
MTRHCGCELMPVHAELYHTLFEESTTERRRVLVETELQALRRSA